MDNFRKVQIGDWIFEVKLVRAIRTRNYGEAYDACATFSFNGDSCYIDSQLTRSDQPFGREDFATFYQFCQQMEVASASYDRYQNGKARRREVNILPSSENQVVVLKTVSG